MTATQRKTQIGWKRGTVRGWAGRPGGEVSIETVKIVKSLPEEFEPSIVNDRP